MKQLRGKTLMSLLYAVILSIPLISILSRVIYVQSNKNAYQSYSGQTQEEATYNNIDLTNYNVGDRYYFISSNNIATSVNGTMTVNVSNVENIGAINTTSNINFTIDETDYLTLWTPATGGQYYLGVEFHKNGENGYYYVNTSNSMNFTFVFKGYGSTKNELITQFNAISYNISYLASSYLDNVFDYSVNQLVDENNFGELNFFEWFSSWLLTDSQNNMLYVRFANWYMNYALLVSLMQILFLCLMWFVNFSRRLLERGMNYDW